MLIYNVRLIPELSCGIASEHGAVEIQGDKITAVYASVPSAMNGETLDGQGMTLLPGLIDAHTHIAGLRGYSSSQLRNPMRFFTQTCLTVQRYLDHGFTTIRDCGAALRVDIAVRDAIEAGLFMGPRVLACGLILTPTESPEDDELYDINSWINSADEARKAARKELAEQSDFVKVMASGSALDRHGIPVQPIITREELQAIVDAAAMKNSYVAAHAHGDGAIRLCIDTGVRTIEHASFISEETTRALLRREDCWLIPTVSAMYQNPETTSEEYQYLIQKLQDMLAQSSGCLHSAYEMGARMGFGTDSCPGMDQYEQGIEFRYRSECCGMRNVDILMQATRSNAEALGIADVTGQIKEGLCADLILVDGRPDEDISVMYHRPDVVFARGVRVRG